MSGGETTANVRTTSQEYREQPVPTNAEGRLLNDILIHNGYNRRSRPINASSGYNNGSVEVVMALSIQALQGVVSCFVYFFNTYNAAKFVLSTFRNFTTMAHYGQIAHYYNIIQSTEYVKNDIL